MAGICRKRLTRRSVIRSNHVDTAPDGSRNQNVLTKYWSKRRRTLCYDLADNTLLRDLGFQSNDDSRIEQDLLSKVTPGGNKPSKRSRKKAVNPSDSSGDKTIHSIQQDVNLLVEGDLTPDSYDRFGPLAYQSIVGLMISNMEEKESTAKEQVFHYNFEDHPLPEGLIPIPKIRRGGQSFSVVGSPSRFSISSVDPLHFIGITPTQQSGQLLHGCKFQDCLQCI